MIRKSIEQALNAERAAFDAFTAKREQIHARMRAEWLAVGGCPHCNGTGEVGYFDTHYGCTGLAEGRLISTTADDPRLASGELVYDSGPPLALFARVTATGARGCTAGSVGKCPTTIVLPEDLRDVEDLEESYRIAKELREAAERDETPHKGATVIVKRGRKVPQGTVGVVVWMEEQHFGGMRASRPADGWVNTRVTVRLGLKVEGQDKLVYTASDNCDVVTPAVDLLLPSLWGTEKQVAWAERIRRDAMTAGTATDADLRNGTARFWIDNRERFAKGAA